MDDFDEIVTDNFGNRTERLNSFIAGFPDAMNGLADLLVCDCDSCGNSELKSQIRHNLVSMKNMIDQVLSING